MIQNEIIRMVAHFRASPITTRQLESGEALTESQALHLATHRHYKGGLYRVISEGRDATTGGPVVLYMHLHPHKPEMWSRPRDEFYGKLADGRDRFAEITHD